MKPEKQEQGTGLSPKSKKNPSSPESLTPKTKQESLSESATDPSKTGSPSPTTETKTSSLESGSESGEKPILKNSRKPKSLMPVPELPKPEKRREQALARLKVKDKDLQAAPRITPLLRNTIKGGLKTALDAMRFSSDDPEIAAFLSKYDAVPVGDRAKLPWEAIALSAKINPKYLLGAIQLAVQTHCWNRSRFIAISNHPDVMEKRVEYAKLTGGEKDRTALDIMNGALASPKGPTFIGKQVAVFGGGKGAAKDDDEEDGKVIEVQRESDDPFESLFPSPSEIQDKLVPIRQRLLEAK